MTTDRIMISERTSNPAEAARAVDGTSKKRGLLIEFAIAAAVLVSVLACIRSEETRPTHPERQFAIGVRYDNGQGVRKDHAVAFRWFHKAAEQGYADAQTNVGLKYNLGEGVTKDKAAAVSWFRRAADQGSGDGQFDLGMMYVTGQGIAKDDAQALWWYQKAADQGQANAQYELGVDYENGQGGMAKDDAQAVSWYQKAAGHGLSRANVAIADVSARQQREQQEQARMGQSERRNPLAAAPHMEPPSHPLTKASDAPALRTPQQ